MQPTRPTTCCPHCGGQSGFLTNVIFKAQRLTEWNGRDVDTENYTLTTETNPKCLDCGKSVRALFK